MYKCISIGNPTDDLSKREGLESILSSLPGHKLNSLDIGVIFLGLGTDVINCESMLQVGSICREHDGLILVPDRLQHSVVHALQKCGCIIVVENPAEQSALEDAVEKIYSFSHSGGEETSAHPKPRGAQRNNSDPASLSDETKKKIENTILRSSSLNNS